MKTRIVLPSLIAVFVVVAAVSCDAAQPPDPPPTPLQVQAQIAALASQVASLQTSLAALQTSNAALEISVGKLDGNITADDLVGTYSIQGFQTELDPNLGSSDDFGQIAASAYTGTVTLNADGTGTITQTQSGWVIDQAFDVTAPDFANHTSTSSFTWTYSNGAVTLSVGGTPIGTANVAVGGRVLSAAMKNTDHTTSLFVYTRLQ